MCLARNLAIRSKRFFSRYIGVCCNSIVSWMFFNSVQGQQYTSDKFTELFLNNDNRISIDARWLAFDNIFIENLWRTVQC